MKLFLVQLSFQHEAPLFPISILNFARLYSCVDGNEALRKGVAEASAQYPHHWKVPNHEVTDVTAIARQFVAMNPGENSEDDPKAGT